VNIEVLAERIGGGSTRAAYWMESLILAILQHDLQLSRKRLVLAPRGGDPAGPLGIESYVDAVAPDGIGELPGPVAIDVTLHRTHRVQRRAWQRSLLHLRDGAERIGARSALLVSGIALPNVLRAQIEESRAEIFEHLEFAIWDASDINRILAKYPDLAESLASRLPFMRLESAVDTEAPDDWKKTRQRILSQLSLEYQRNRVALFLGAGVSIDAGLPDWSSLVNALFVSFVDKQLLDSESLREDEVDAIVSRLQELSDPSPLLTSRYLRRGIGESPTDDSAFIGHVAKALYRSKGATREPRGLALALARFCVPRRTGPGVRAIVTYNFDDLIERALGRAQVEHQSVADDGIIVDEGRLPVFHVHGFLPRDDEENGLRPNALVFSEERYHTLGQDPYHWSNMVQLGLLKDTTALFVGLSLTDPNLRRLLEISARSFSAPRHIAVMRRVTADSFLTRRDGKPVRARKGVVRSFVAIHNQVQEEVLQELGLQVMWVESYDEVPGLLERARRGE